MKTTMTASAVLVLVSLCAWSQTQEVDPGYGAGSLMNRMGTPRSCISKADLEIAHEALASYRNAFGPLSTAGPLDLILQPYPFYPMGGEEGGDILLASYPDHDPGPNALDWDCTDRSYDGHTGSDGLIRNFAYQDIGVPIFAALDGLVVFAIDGNTDRNTSWQMDGEANFVILDHGNGQLGWYWHFKKGSVAVVPGQFVRAGEQLGLTGSSGRSTWPHLHYETRVVRGADQLGATAFGSVIDPYTGPCNPEQRLWVQQMPIERTMGLYDFGVTNRDPRLGAWFPEALPTSSHLSFSDQTVYLWSLTLNLPANSTWRVRFRRPDGTVVLNTRNQPFGNAAPWFWTTYMWWFNVPQMQQIAGTWRILLDYNGTHMFTAYVEVMATTQPGFNRPPEPITVSIDPPTPTPDDVLRCRIATHRVMDDPDWDVVRYDYEWRINGTIVRSVTSAGWVDAIPHHMAASGDLVTCDVTPSDGQASGATVNAQAIIR